MFCSRLNDFGLFPCYPIGPLTDIMLLYIDLVFGVVTSWQPKVFLGYSVFTALPYKRLHASNMHINIVSLALCPQQQCPPSATPHKRPRPVLSYPRDSAALRAIEGLHCAVKGTWFWLVPNLDTHSLTHSHKHTQQGQLPLEAHLDFISCLRQKAIRGGAW